MTGRQGNNYLAVLRAPTLAAISSGARGNTPLNVAYVHLASGAAAAVRYQARTADPITELYVMLDTVTGTLASITMACRIYNEHASNAAIPGSTLRATATAVTMPSAGIKWIKVAFGTPYTPAIGETLWFILNNSSAAPTVDIPNILTATNTTGPSNVNHGTGYVTANGFSTAGTAMAKMPFVVNQSGNYFGQPITATGTPYGSVSTRRGIVVKPPVDIEVSGFEWPVLSTAYTNIAVFDPSSVPSGSALAVWQLGSDANASRDEVIGSKTVNPYVFQGGKTCYVVFSFSAAVSLTGLVIEDYSSFPSIFDALIDGFSNCAAVSDVSNVWTVRNDHLVPLQLIVTDLLPASNRASYQMGM